MYSWPLARLPSTTVLESPPVAKGSFSVKGTHLLTSRAWVDARLGEGSFAKLEAEVRAPWDARVLPSGWYDVFALVRIITKVTKPLEMDVMKAVSEIATINAQQDLTTIYRAFLRLAGPRGLLNATPTLWRNYVAFGEVKKLTNEAGLHIAELYGVPDELLDWACGCWDGFIPTAVTLAGGTSPALTIDARGADPTATEPGFSFLRARIEYKV